MKKKILIAAGAALAAAAVSVFVYANSGKNAMDDFFNANVEALAKGETGIGRICAYDTNRWCIYMFPYEEYEGVFVSDIER